jgi:hypothetical protein
VINVDAPQGYLKLELDGSASQYNPTTLVRRGGEAQFVLIRPNPAR